MKKNLLILLLMLSQASVAEVSEKEFVDGIKNTNVTEQLEVVAAGTLKKKEYTRYLTVMERLVELRPQDTRYWYGLAKAYSLNGDKSKAYNALIKLQNAGFSYSIDDPEIFTNINDTKVYNYIVDGMANNAKPYGKGEVVGEIPAHYSGMLFESFVFDAQNNRFLMGSVRSGEVYTLDATGGFKSFIKPEMGAHATYGVVDMVLDAKNNQLWVATASMPQFNGVTPDNLGKTTLSVFDVIDGSWIENKDLSSVNAPNLINALHLTASGDLLFFNVLTKEIFELKKGQNKPSSFIKTPQLGAIKAITSNEDGSYIYLSDYDQGIFVVNAEDKQVKILINPEAAFLAGINDLVYEDGDLIAMQSKTSPARVMRILLNNDIFYQGAVPLESAQPDASNVGQLDVNQNDVYYIANSQWDKMDMAGNLQKDLEWEPLKVIKADAKYKLAEHLESQKRIEEIKKKRGIK